VTLSLLQALKRFLEEELGPGMEKAGEELHAILARMQRNLQATTPQTRNLSPDPCLLETAHRKS
jgi:hypothetical protein